MKTKLFFLFSMALGFFANQVIAQTAFEWDYHGIGFEVASDFRVQTNNQSEFTAVSSDGLLAVTLMPWSDASINLDDLAEATLSLAGEMATIDQSTVDGDAIDLGDLEGYFIVAATSDYKSYDYILVALLLDTESETNLVAVIGFQDGHDEEAIEILTSIYPYDP